MLWFFVRGVIWTFLLIPYADAYIDISSQGSHWSGSNPFPEIKCDNTLFDPLVSISHDVGFVPDFSGPLICGLCQSCFKSGDRRASSRATDRVGVGSAFDRQPVPARNSEEIDDLFTMNGVLRRYHSDSELYKVRDVAKLQEEQPLPVEEPGRQRILREVLHDMETKVGGGIDDHEILGCKLFTGEIIFDDIYRPYVVKDGKRLRKDSVAWNKFMREKKWGEKFVEESCMVELYGTSVKSRNSSVSTPVALVYPKYSTNIFHLLIKRHDFLSKLSCPIKNSLTISLQSMSLSDEDIFRVLNLTVEAIELLVSHQAVHTQLLPDSVHMVFSDDLLPYSVLGHLGAVFSVGSRVAGNELERHMLPPEVIKAIQRNSEIRINNSIMLWQLGILSGMMADIDFFSLFFVDHRSVRVDRDVKKGAYDFSCQMQVEVEDLFSINSVTVTKIILNRKALSLLDRKECFSDNRPSVEGVLLILAWYLLDPNVDKRPSIQEVKSFLSLFNHVFCQ